MKRTLLLAVTLTGMLSCNLVAPKLEIPPIPVIDFSAVNLPKNVDGKYLLMQLSTAQLEVDPTMRDPITALGDCTDSITYCYAPGTRELDACVAGVRACATDKPWLEPTPCCPRKCEDDFAALRTSGTDAPDALDQVFFASPTCFPGVAAALEGK